MIKAKNIFLLAFLGLVLGFAACKSKPPSTGNEGTTTEAEGPGEEGLAGNWQLRGFVNPGSNALNPIKTMNNKPITIRFIPEGENGGKLEGKTEMNSLFGKYSFEGNSIRVSEWGGTKAMDSKPGNKFRQGMRVVHHFAVEGSVLRLTYDEMNAVMVLDRIK